MEKKKSNGSRNPGLVFPSHSFSVSIDKFRVW